MDRNYPTTTKENIRHRIEVINRCKTDMDYRSNVYTLCSKDIIFWIDTFCWTYNPNLAEGSKVIPFICYDFQVEAIFEICKAIDEGYDILGEKTREMGLSWLVIYIYDHYALFKKDVSFKTGSWKENYVDKIGDLDGHFEKLRFIHKRLPEWMFPNQVKSEIPFMKLVLDNDNSIVGETAGQHWGSGGRKTSLFMDEFGKWENTQSDGSWTSTADITKCRIVISTPRGLNKYQRLATGEEGNIKVLTLHWTLHPDKAKDCYFLEEDGSHRPLKWGKEAFEVWKLHRLSKAPDPLLGGLVRSPWYDAECIRRGKASDIAQELDIDYLGSGYPFFDAYSIQRQKVHMIEPLGIVNLYDMPYNEVEPREERTGRIKLYEVPSEDEEYYIIIDASKARGIDEGSIYVGNARLNRTTAVVNGDYDEDELSDMAILLGRWLNMALIIPENSCGYGNAVTKNILKKYHNVYVMPERQKKAVGSSSLRPQDYGFTTTGKTRPEMLAYYDEDLRMGSVRILDKDVIRQTETFIINPKNKKAEAAEGKQDGLVICRSIFSYILRERPFKIRISGRREKVRGNVAHAKEQMNAGITYGRS